MHTPNLDVVPAICFDCSDIIWIGTESGILYALFATEQSIKKVAPISWKSIFPHAQKSYSNNPIVSIRVNKRKPYRILVGFKYTGAVIYNFNVIL